MLRRISCAALALAFVVSALATASDWPRFRGANGSGLAPDESSTPVNWDESTNLKWKIDLPGPGLSSPIVVGDRVFVTCWTGYATGDDSSGDKEDLKRVLVCIDRETGNELWSRSVDAVLPEDDFRGMFAENGYASHTPVSNGKQVFAFYGKSGVYAYDMQGEELWHKSVGTGLDRRSWGSASSPILYKNMVIVTAAPESETLYAFDQETGKEIWKQEGSLSGTWSTPILVKVDDQETDLVISVNDEIWGMNPDNGKLRWWCIAPDRDSGRGSIVASDGVVYRLGGRDGDAIAVRAGGKGDVTETHVVWSERESGSVVTPVLYNEKLYWVNNGVANCVDAKTGENLKKKRLSGGSGGSGRRGGNNYSSPIVADGKMYYVTRGGSAFVIQLNDNLEQLATNQFESDEGEYSSTPAVADGQIFLRSTEKLYCIEE